MKICNLILFLPRSAFRLEPKRGRPLKMTPEMKTQLILKGAGSISEALFLVMKVEFA